MKTPLANFDDHVRPFFESWGLFPKEERPEDIDVDFIEQLVINSRCYAKLLEDADRHAYSSKYGSYLRAFCHRVIDATDGSFYLKASIWAELRAAWDTFLTHIQTRNPPPRFVVRSKEIKP